MSILNQIKPKPSNFKLQLKKYGIPACSVSAYLQLSYPHTVNLLNGVSRITPPVERKLKQLVAMLEAQAGNGDAP
jgi:hypothetical protein